MAKDQVGLHFRTAQVQIPVFQAQVFIRIDTILDVERRRLGTVQNIQGVRHDFDVARRDVRVHRFGRALPHFAKDLDDVLRTDRLGVLEAFAGIGINDNLANPRTVAQINEDQSAMVTALGNPAAQRHFLARIRFGQGTAVVVSLKFLTHSCAPLSLILL